VALAGREFQIASAARRAFGGTPGKRLAVRGRIQR
jgi:hypothetical protein